MIGCTSGRQMQLDPAGNILRESNKLQREYCYNAQNRISEYYENGQLKARYHYNALGQRIHKAVIQNDGTEQHTLFHYGQQGELLGETHLAGNDESSESGSSQNIVWLQMRPVVALDSSTISANSKPADTQISWLHSDHLLTARAATDANQNLIWRWHSDAFGVGEAESFTANGQNNQSTEEEFTLNLRFPGQYHDAESGLHYNYHRTYDPSMGRYTQSDPIGLMGGVNTYSYALNNSMRYIDIFGLYTEIIIWQPVGWKSSSFGHVSANVNGRNYSWGPNGWDTKYPIASDYASRQSTFRSGVGVTLSLTAEQESQLELCYAQEHGKYSTLSNNCGDPHKNCLEKALGIPVSDSLFPVNIGNDLLGSPYYDGSIFYEGPERSFWDDGLWVH